MAALGGAPCVFLSSNSHKTRSLQAVLGIQEPREFPLLELETQVNDVVQAALTAWEAPEATRQELRETCGDLARRAAEVTALLAKSGQ
jgi:hypothetical protein